MNPLFLIDVKMDENDKKLLIILLLVFIVVFILLGFIGMIVRKIMDFQGNRLDKEMGDVARAGVVKDPASFKRLARAKNRRIYMQESIIPISLALITLLIYVITCTVKENWSENIFGNLGTLFYRFDWNDPDNFATFWGVSLLRKWPPLLKDTYGGLPTLVPEYWLSYVCGTLWIIAIGYYLFVTQGFIARGLRANKRASTIYDHHLDTFNYYDSIQGNPTNAPTQATPPPSEPVKK